VELVQQQHLDALRALALHDSSFCSA